MILGTAKVPTTPHSIMRFHTPYRFRFAYAGIDTKASAGDELLGLSIFRFYFGLYPTQTGIELAYGILNANDSL